MNPKNSRFFFGAAVGCALLAGCSKTETPNTPAAATGDKPAPATASAATTPVPGKESGPVELRVKWSVGKKIVSHLEQTQNSEGSIPGLPQPIKTSTKSGIDYSLTGVKENADGGWELDLMLLGQQVESKMGESTTMSFNSDSAPATDAGNAVAQTLRKTIGAHFKCQTDRVGKVVKVDGVSDFTKRVSAGGDGQTVMAAKSMFNDESLKEMASIGQQLPDHAVKPGDTWTGKQESDAGPVGKLVLNWTYTFKGWEQHGDQNCVVVTCKGDITTTPGPATANGVTATVDSGTTTGTTWFNPASGMLVESATENSMNLKVKAMGQELNSKVLGATTVKIMPEK